MDKLLESGKLGGRRNGLLWAVAVALFVCGTLAGWMICVRVPHEAPDIVVMGDSLFAVGRGGDAVADRLEVRLQAKILNAAMGGTSLARADREKRMDHTMDSMSLIALTKAMLSKDYSVQKQARIKESATDYFDEVIESLGNVDFGKVRVLLIGYGMNDYQNGVPLENTADYGVGAEYCFGDALCRVLEDLKKEYPSLRVILVSPTYSWYLSNGRDCEEQDWGGGVLEQYVRCEQQIAAEYHVEFIDLYHGLYEHEDFQDWEKYTVDGVHPNGTGKALMVEKIGKYLEEHP